MDEKSIKRISGDCKREKCYLLTSFCRRDSPGNISVIVPQDYIPKSSQIFVLPSNKVTFLLVFVKVSHLVLFGEFSRGDQKLKGYHLSLTTVVLCGAFTASGVRKLGHQTRKHVMP